MERSQAKPYQYQTIANNIIESIPIGKPVEWCSKMVVVPKKDERPPRTIDFQHLNSQCQCKTHHCQAPFNLTCQIPPNLKKTVLDAVDGYHAIPLDEASRPLTTFISEWGQYCYLQLPQGYFASEDTYTQRYNELIKDIPMKVKYMLMGP